MCRVDDMSFNLTVTVAVFLTNYSRLAEKRGGDANRNFRRHLALDEDIFLLVSSDMVFAFTCRLPE